jgi:hypothetical protein
MKRTLALALAATLGAACGAPVDVDDTADDVIVPEGKDDNFYSTSAREYFFSGQSTVTLEDDLASASAAAKLGRARELVKLKNIAVSWFLNQYIIAKEDDASNVSYGGFGAIVKFDSEVASDPVSVDGKTYRFDYKVQVGGTKTLLSKIPGTSVTGGGKRFDLEIGKVPNAELARLEINSEWYRSAPWSDWDPSKVAADRKETITLTAVPQPASSDSWLPYDRLFADGKVTIGVHFGWDYHSRYDIIGSRNLYNWLVSQGWRSPVASYEKLERTSGPLTKTVVSNGKRITLELSIFHPGDASQGVPGPDPDTAEGGKLLEADMRESFKSREVIVFEGHSGPLYGFALANWRKTDEGDLDDSKIPGLEMPRDTFQIVLANGCDTYALGQAFWKNPAKADKQNLNVITSTSFSNAGTDESARRLIRALSNQTGGKVEPVKVSELTAGLDADQGYYFTTMYGVHGADANPRYNPMSDASKLCQRCTTQASCGADGNRCTQIASRVKACTIGCIDDTGCPTGYACRAVASSTTRTLKTKQCVPTSLRCN